MRNIAARDVRPFEGKVSMNYQAFTNETLLMMHHGARGALTVDDELARLGEELRFRVRDTLNWTMHIAELENEMARRGMTFEVIDWSLPTPECDQKGEEAKPIDRATHLSTRIAAVMRIRNLRPSAKQPD
jgi:hypothetical protein